MLTKNELRVKWPALNNTCFYRFFFAVFFEVLVSPQSFYSSTDQKFMKNDSGEKKQDFLSLPEVQTFLSIKSRKTILKYIKSGKLPAYKIGGTRWRFAVTDVRLFVQKYKISNNKADL